MSRSRLLLHYRCVAPSSQRVHSHTTSGSGFTLLELLVVLAVFGILTATALALVLEANRSLQHRLRSSNLVDNALIALAGISREIRMAGFPSAASFAASAVASRPGIVATSFVAATSYDLILEADSDNDGRVEQIRYLLPPGSSDLLRNVTLKNADGSLDSASSQSTIVLENVQNQIQGRPLFRWDIDAASSKPFPQNIRTVYINVILAADPDSNGAASISLSASCQRLNP